ncbi:nuclear transport factor 2 family protein [Gordonia terrae]|uniref:Nuclear transport factor 2 family protein n=1 Tax=Gordonia terrae TaxID=2055 RepID=A0A2I1RA18_9ACTN|nr:nuclear transport factor 2 family protein [Gordonia terrae]PKZ65949.1 nuclear transport factor 2 family protein [Gordonia terrae]
MTSGSDQDLVARLTRLEDLEAIRLLDARYCRHLDDGDWDALMTLFTADGEFDGLSNPRGKDEMREFFAGLADGGLTSFWHFITNLEIEVDGNDAAARSFLWQPCVLDGVASIAAGRYTDTLVKQDGRWLYRVKRVRFHFFGPLADGWDENRFALESARAAAVNP